MARLNEPALSTDSIEILRKKMLRQNRELAKTNNIRALRVRELESELSRALTENIELRGRILQLENEANDSDARRIADHAMVIKEKLEAQLTEWGTLIAGLGLEPPIKQHSPRVSKAARPRMSLTLPRPSPSQRRLRDIAHDVQQLGYIDEHKTCLRQSINPEQIQALRSEAGADDTPELPPPPAAAVIDQEPTKIDTPPRDARARNFTSGLDSSPLVVSSPNLDDLHIGSVSTQNKITPMIRESRVHVDSTPDTPIALPIKAGSKRKFNRDEYEPMTLDKITDENLPPRVSTKRPSPSILNKVNGKTLKELAALRRETARAQAELPKDTTRRPLAAKSTNDDVQSPKKMRRTASADEISTLKMANTTNRPKPVRSTVPLSIKTEETRDQERGPLSATIERYQRVQAALTASSSPRNLSRSYSPEAAAVELHRGDTPPPAEMGSQGETSRPSRRSRAAISYAEPNLRDKMRRPRNETFDAVSGEGKSRRFSQSEVAAVDIKRESGGSDSWRQLAAAHHPRVSDLSTERASVSPLSSSSASPQDVPTAVSTGRRKRTSYLQTRESDVYEFASSSPKVDETSEPAIATRTSARRVIASRRLSTAAESENHNGIPMTREPYLRTRRRSMMV